jgi:hypothetical protein
LKGIEKDSLKLQQKAKKEAKAEVVQDSMVLIPETKAMIQGSQTIKTGNQS